MTRRVFDCRRGDVDLERAPRARATRPPLKGFTIALLAAVVLVPLAGSADAPQGWFAAAVSAVGVLGLVRLVGRWLPWGLVTVLVAVVAIVTPRGVLPGIGPALFVATCLCVIFWLANRPAEPTRERPRPGSPERRAQVLMGLSGERDVREVLARELPEDYVLINGLKLPRGAGDIDHLVVGPTGVFLLETKTMAGRIVCGRDGTWTRTRVGRAAGTVYPAFIGNPAAQVQRNILATRDCVRKCLPGLFSRPQLWIEGLIVFPHPRTELDADHSHVPALRLDQATAYICTHVPQRGLEPPEVDQVVEALLVEAGERAQTRMPAAQSAQALIEVALALPLVLALCFGAVALSRVVQAQTAVVAVAHEAARAGALGNSTEDAVGRMQQRVEVVAPGLGLDPRSLVLDWDVSGFARLHGRVLASVRYTVDLSDLPLGGWVPEPSVRAEHVEWVDPYRSGISDSESQPN